MYRRSIFSIFVVVFLAVSLVGCSSEETGFIKPNTPTAPSDDAELVVKIGWWLTQVAWSAATVPIIGPLVTGILGEMSPEDHWIVGGVIILIILGIFGGSQSSS